MAGKQIPLSLFKVLVQALQDCGVPKHLAPYTARVLFERGMIREDWSQE